MVGEHLASRSSCLEQCCGGNARGEAAAAAAAEADTSGSEQGTSCAGELCYHDSVFNKGERPFLTAATLAYQGIISAMSTKYQTGHQVPAEFPRILKEFVREILRYQPKNIYQFGAEYFEDKLQGGSQLSPLQMSEEQLIQYFHGIFLAADTDGSGLLDKSEFKKLMKSSEINIPKKAVKVLYTEVCDSFCHCFPRLFELVLCRLVLAHISVPDGF